MSYSYSDVVKKAEEYRAKHPQLRAGQALVNALFEFDEDLYHAIKATDADPFYDDKKITNLHMKIVEKGIPYFEGAEK